MNDDYVKRSDVHKVFQPKYAPAINKTLAAMIDRVPAADVAPVRHGRWIVKGDAQPVSNDKVYGCSLCDDKNRRYYEWQLSNYCPNCGAKMDIPEPPKEEDKSGN